MLVNEDHPAHLAGRKNGKLKHCYNFLGITLSCAESTRVIPAGTHQVHVEFKYDAAAWRKEAPSRSSWTARGTVKVESR